ncbi:hypothetical protein Cni_G00880 [Canna indica]|uniref:Uncharacterized protein n=1 Tax=Canna indica TaxID=4628 RepID=A0AAQ3JNM6_9LILI|nr:hypothetical protein Cni_G00880 [Canna indica]
MDSSTIQHPPRLHEASTKLALLLAYISPLTACKATTGKKNNNNKARSPLSEKEEKRRRMGRPGTDHAGCCRRHPKHRMSVGVCPCCLRERLSHLSHHSSASYLSSSASSSPYTSDSDLSSSASSPPRHHDVKRARVSFLLRRESTAAAAGGAGLTKSRSMILEVVRGDQKEDKEAELGKGKEKKKKKEKFWSKLLSGSKRWPKKEGAGALMHSQTFKEKPSAKWVLF